MSMIMMLESVSADALVEHNEPAISFSSSSIWGADIFGGDQDNGNAISLEKAWHGLHFLLTGDPWSGTGYRAFLLCGGTEQGEDMGYGPARVFDPGAVTEIARVLTAITTDELWSRFDAERMAAADLYGAAWSEEPEEDLREEYTEYFEMLKEFVSDTAESGNALRITMT